MGSKLNKWSRKEQKNSFGEGRRHTFWRLEGGVLNKNWERNKQRVFKAVGPAVLVTEEHHISFPCIWLGKEGRKDTHVFVEAFYSYNKAMLE